MYLELNQLISLKNIEITEYLKDLEETMIPKIIFKVYVHAHQQKII